MDFLLHCKDPKSKERALLQVLEGVKLKQQHSTGDGNNSSGKETGEVNLKPFTLNSSVSLQEKSTLAVSGSDLGGKSVKVVERQAVNLRKTSRTRSMAHTVHRNQTRSSNTADTATVSHPVERDKTFNANSLQQGKVETMTDNESKESITVSDDTKCSSSDPCVISTAQNPATEQTEPKTARAPPSLSEVNHGVSDGAKKAGDNPLMSLKQYLTVNLTRLSVPQIVEAEKATEGRKGKVVVRGKCRQSRRTRPETLPAQAERRVSRSQQKQAGNLESSTSEGNRGVREMYFKAINKVNLRKRHASETVGDLSQSEKSGNDKVIEIQKVSGEEKDCAQKKDCVQKRGCVQKKSCVQKEGCVQKEQQDIIKGKIEEQTEKIYALTTPVKECKGKGALKESKGSESEIVSTETPRGQNNMQGAKNTVKDVCKEEGVGKLSEPLSNEMVRNLIEQSAGKQKEDIVIKQAKVLLSDILRKDKLGRATSLEEYILRSRLCTSAEKEKENGSTTQSCATEGENKTEINGGRCPHAVQKRKIRRKRRSRGAKSNAECKQSSKGHLGKDVTATLTTELSQESFKLQSSQRLDVQPTACLNPLPQESVISTKATSNLHTEITESNPQTHIQSNIPLKKRMFRNSMDIDCEQGYSSVADQASKQATKLNLCTGQRQDLTLCPGEGIKVKKESKCRFRRSEIQKLTSKRIIKPTSVTRVLRSRANAVQRSQLLKKIRKCKLEKQDEEEIGNGQALANETPSQTIQVKDPAKIPKHNGKNPSINQPVKEDEVEVLPLQQTCLKEETNPTLNFKIRFKRRRGKLWEMEPGSLEDVSLKTEKKEELLTCDPFKAIMDSVSVLNMEMEAAQAHVQASMKSKNRLHRLKRRGLRLKEKQGQNFHAEMNSDKDQDVGPAESPNDKQEIKEKCDMELLGGVQPLAEEADHKNDCDMLSTLRQETKTEDRFLKSCCVFESGSQHKQEPELDFDGFPLPVIKLKRKAEDIWEVDSKDEEYMETEPKVETVVKTEMKGPIFGKQQKGLWDIKTLKEECPSFQKPNSNAAPLKGEPPPFSLSLSPLSLSSPLSEGKTEVVGSVVDQTVEKPAPDVMSGGGRKQRHKAERARKSGTVEIPTTCLSHTLQQIDNSLSRLSEGLCASQTLEKPTAFSGASTSVIQPPSQSPPFTTADSMLSTEPSFANCCDDILDFQCLNFEGYYQPQNILPSSPSDLCSLDPPTDPFSSPLSHSPSDTWNTETPYLGPPSPGNNFTAEELPFFPSLISSKNDSVPLECDVKDTSKDRNPTNSTNFSFSALHNTDVTAKDRFMSKNSGLRTSKEDHKAQPVSVVNKPRLFGAASSAVTSQSYFAPAQPTSQIINVKASTSQPKAQSSLKTQGPFHRMSFPNKSQSFPTIQSNAIRSMPQSSPTKSVHSSQMSSKFLSPQLFTVKNPNPPDNPFNFHEKTSTVIHRVLKFQGGNQSQNLYSAPCRDSVAAGSPAVMSKTPSSKSGAIDKTQQSQKIAMSSDCHKSNDSVHGFTSAKDVGHLSASSNHSRPNSHYNKVNSSFSQSFGKKISSDKLESNETNLTYKNFSAMPRPFFFPSKASECYSPPQDKNLKQDKSTSSTSDKQHPCYIQQDPFDFSFGPSLSPMSQHSSPQVAHSTPPGTPAPTNKSQSSSSSASFPYGYQGPPYVLNFTGDHSVTLGLRDGAEGLSYPGLGPTNYTYHCLMEPSGAQGRLVLEPCGPQHSNPTAFSLGGFSGLKGQDEHCRKDMQQQCQPGDHPAAPHYGPHMSSHTSSHTSSHSMGATKPKRVRLVVTDGTVDLDLQYSD